MGSPRSRVAHSGRPNGIGLSPRAFISDAVGSEISIWLRVDDSAADRRRAGPHGVHALCG